jgi:hypothetical protein
MTLKEHKEAKLLMTKIVNAAKAIRRDVHEFHLHDETFAQLSCLTIVVAKAQVLLDAFKDRHADVSEPVLHDRTHDMSSLVNVVADNGVESRHDLVVVDE